jgi:hypothetical protein|tara:strand:- start:137 stop:268 length:132 start_codon:yes stop_codon:yes gene_type:complete
METEAALPATTIMPNSLLEYVILAAVVGFIVWKFVLPKLKKDE